MDRYEGESSRCVCMSMRGQKKAIHKTLSTVAYIAPLPLTVGDESTNRVPLEVKLDVHVLALKRIAQS